PGIVTPRAVVHCVPLSPMCLSVVPTSYAPGKAQHWCSERAYIGRTSVGQDGRVGPSLGVLANNGPTRQAPDKRKRVPNPLDQRAAERRHDVTPDGDVGALGATLGAYEEQ